MNLDLKIRKICDFPKPGILFYDVTSVFMDVEAYRFVIDSMISIVEEKQIDGVIGIESRGFLLAGNLAYLLKKPLILARKKGKLPGETYCCDYELEYGFSSIEIHREDLKPNSNYLIVDDLIATGGTIEAVAKIVTSINSNVVACLGIIGLPFLNFKQRIGAYNPVTLINYDSE